MSLDPMDPSHGMPGRETGFTLIEVLVAIVVISLGVLGMAALQFMSLRGNNQSYERTQATALAYEMADQMRGNAAQANAGAFNLTPATPLGNPNNCTAGNCTPPQIAAYAIRQWRQRISAVLPGGTASIVRSVTPCPATGCMQTVTVMWDENRTGAAGTGCNPDVSGDMACVRASFLTQQSFFP